MSTAGNIVTRTLAQSPLIAVVLYLAVFGGLVFASVTALSLL